MVARVVPVAGLAVPPDDLHTGGVSARCSSHLPWGIPEWRRSREVGASPIESHFKSLDRFAFHRAEVRDVEFQPAVVLAGS